MCVLLAPPFASRSPLPAVAAGVDGLADVPPVNDWLAAQKLEPAHLRRFLERLTHPAVPNLPRLIAANLRNNEHVRARARRVRARVRTGPMRSCPSVRTSWTTR